MNEPELPEIGFDQIAAYINSFQWWTFILGSDAVLMIEVIDQLRREYHLDASDIIYIQFPNAFGVIVMLRKTKIPKRMVWKALQDIAPELPMPRAVNPNASTDVIVPMTPNSILMAEFLRQHLSIDPGYGRNVQN